MAWKWLINMPLRKSAFKGIITDLLIGDRFTDCADAAWEPMESLYPAGKASIAPRNADAPAEMAQNKVNELFLPSIF